MSSNRREMLALLMTYQAHSEESLWGTGFDITALLISSTFERSTSKSILKTSFLLQRVYCKESTSSSSRFKKVKYFHCKPIIPDGKNQELPSIVKQGYYMVKLDIKKAYLHVLVNPHYRDLSRFVWKGVHYRWKTMPFGLSTAPRIFTMLLRPVLRMLRELNVSVIAY
ncbi:hypothetical protein ACTFIU_011146 [Dictyostelium citrinum]